MVMITSVFFGAVGFALASALRELLGVAPDVFHGALGFLRVSFVGIIFVFMYAMISVAWFARGSWKTVRLSEDDVQVAEVTREAVLEEGMHKNAQRGNFRKKSTLC